MPIEVECECGHQIHIPEGWQTASTTCPNCGSTVAFANDDAADETAPVAAARACPVCGTKFLPREHWCTHCKAELDDLAKWRRDPQLAVAAGKCPACCGNMLPRESACPRCQVVVKDYLEGVNNESEHASGRVCRTCGKRLLPNETACPQCKTPAEVV
ncbi:Double zinc ribbon [Symmachiella macrocystis]|uniref:Double zinc ribbon n=1 Tax=Symmachiella macrocystis TaxID=2527985 RepID=A0A5C6BSL9_9PLAN|nr:hypothetical protein [Symmachiella macrocystis]TWU14216.1 Double zinc ribbon [Symmachiella macrocystis]